MTVSAASLRWCLNSIGIDSPLSALFSGRDYIDNRFLLNVCFFVITAIAAPLTVTAAIVYHTTPTTVQTVRTSFCEKGLNATISRKKRETPPVPAKITGEVEAKVIALACSNSPEGYSKWTLRLLADRTVELGYIDAISYVSVMRILIARPINT